MSVFTQGLYAHLRDQGGAPLAALLGTYNGGPCLFTGDVPADAPRPYVLIFAPYTDDAFDTKRNDGRYLERDIWVVTDATASLAVREELAEMLRGLLHRRAIPIEGYATVVSLCRGNGEIPSDGTVRGLSLTSLLTLAAS